MPRDDFEQRGFAGAIAADQPDAVLGRDQPVEIIEQKFVSESFAGRGELQHL